MKIATAVVANRCSDAPTRKRATEPSMGTSSAPRITRFSETDVASSTTAPIDHILASMISAGVTGMTSRCSTVPCSRSRISAAPVRMIDSIVTWLTSSMREMNHDCRSAGLNRARRARSTGGTATLRCRWTNSATSPIAIICTRPAPAKAWPMRVASTLSWSCGVCPASTSRWKLGGMSST